MKYFYHTLETALLLIGWAYAMTRGLLHFLAVSLLMLGLQLLAIWKR